MPDRPPLTPTTPARSISALAAVACLLLVPVAVSALVVMGPANTWADLTRDMAATSGAPPWLGLLSFVGVLYWTAGAAIALFSAGLAERHNGDARFLAILGFLLAALAVDDLFMVHEVVLPALGMTEDLVKVAYVGTVAAFGIVYRHRFRGPARITAVAAAGAFGLSLAVDAVSNQGNLSTTTEGLLKLVGIVLLLFLTVQMCRAALQRHRLAARPEEASDEPSRPSSVA